MNYIKSGNFLADIISAIPISEFFDDNNQEIRLINLTKILRLLRLGRLLKKIKSDKMKTFGHLIKSFIIFILILHWLTCFWFFIAEKDYNIDTATMQNTWIPANVRMIADSTNRGDPDVIHEFYNYPKFD
jgi:hypothetical protein